MKGKFFFLLVLSLTFWNNLFAPEGRVLLFLPFRPHHEENPFFFYRAAVEKVLPFALVAVNIYTGQLVTDYQGVAKVETNDVDNTLEISPRLVDIRSGLGLFLLRDSAEEEVSLTATASGGLRTLSPFVISFRAPGRATSLKIIAPTKEVVNANLPIYLEAVDEKGQIDFTYTGRAKIHLVQESQSISFIPPHGEVDLTEGKGRIFLTSTREEKVKIYAKDLSSEKPLNFSEDASIYFLPRGGAAEDLIIEGHELAPTETFVQVTLILQIWREKLSLRTVG
jgi:hypothetical protein